MAQRHTSKGTAIAGHTSKRVIVAADRSNAKGVGAKSGKTYSSTRLGAECGKLKGERAC